MPFKPLPPKPQRTRDEIAAILDQPFRAPNFAGASRDALMLADYWHSVAMRYRSMAADAQVKWDKTPRSTCLTSLDIIALSDEMNMDAKDLKPRRLER